MNVGRDEANPVHTERGVEQEEESRPRRLARPILVAFLFTFMAARVLVFLIVARRIPDVYLSLGGTHVHHLNYGIFLRSGVGAYLLLISTSPSMIRG